MRNYKIMLRSAGGITQLPDSQKIFGALTTKYAESRGDKKASEMAEAVLEKRGHLALSNVFPLNYFPMPLDYVSDRLAREEMESLKERRTELKKRDYIDGRGLKSIMETEQPGWDKSIFPYVRKTDAQQLRASMENTLYGMEGLEARLYTVPTLKLQEVRQDRNGKQETGSVSEFYFYFQGDESETTDALLELLRELQKNQTTLILGKRASQGLNQFLVTGMEKIRLPQADRYLNMGMLLPDRINFAASTLRLFTSERRPFSVMGGWSCQKQFISFIDCGSVIVLQEGIEQAGRCIRSPFCANRDIVFGSAFLYPIAEDSKYPKKQREEPV